MDISMHEKIIKGFIVEINEPDPMKISDLITEDHRFIDAHENEISRKISQVIHE